MSHQIEGSHHAIKTLHDDIVTVAIGKVIITVNRAAEEGFEDERAYHLRMQGGTNQERIDAAKIFLQAVNREIARQKPQEVPAPIWQQFNHLPDGSNARESLTLFEGDIWVKTEWVHDEKYTANLSEIMKQVASRPIAGLQAQR